MITFSMPAENAFILGFIVGAMTGLILAVVGMRSRK
jgi:uncharacterized transporter YbjL